MDGASYNDSFIQLYGGHSAGNFGTRELLEPERYDDTVYTHLHPGNKIYGYGRVIMNLRHL